MRPDCSESAPSTGNSLAGRCVIGDSGTMSKHALATALALTLWLGLPGGVMAQDEVD